MDAPDIDFASLGLAPELVAGLTELGYEAPTPIQARAIPAMLSGRDLQSLAATGTGKTAAFALPILDRIAQRQDRGKNPTALVLTPTRELCMQVSQAIHRYGRPFQVRTLPVFGGQPIGHQVSVLKRGVDVVVATPGRAMDLLERRYLKLDDIDTVILDEADEMLDMGFAEDIDTILSAAPAERQTAMFSATMPKRIIAIARKHLQDPEFIEIARAVVEPGDRPAITQYAYIVSRQYKAAALGRILDNEMPTAAIVFCRTRADVDTLTETLSARGYRAEALHGGMDQNHRDKVMNRLRSGQAELLIATDVAARGLDVEQLTHVFNYDVPAAPESYVHRVGRVGRGGREGVAITIADPREGRQLSAIERSTKQKIRIETLPSVDDMRQRRLEVTRAALELVCRDEDLYQYRGVLAALVQEVDVERVALAAIKFGHINTVGEADDEVIPQPGLMSSDKGKKRGKAGRDRDRDHADSRDRDRSGRRDSRRDGDRPNGRDRDWDYDRRERKGSGGKKYAGGDKSGKVTIQIGLGKDAGVRPQDVVGAIANETSLSGRDVGAVKISERSATAEVPANSVKQVIDALNRTRIQGRKVKARRNRD